MPKTQAKNITIELKAPEIILKKKVGNLQSLSGKK